jgi:hypothetical protein
MGDHRLALAGLHRHERWDESSSVGNDLQRGGAQSSIRRASRRDLSLVGLPGLILASGGDGGRRSPELPA